MVKHSSFKGMNGDRYPGVPPNAILQRMENQFFEVAIMEEKGEWYTVMTYPEEEGGSVMRSGPFKTRNDAMEKAKKATSIIQKFLGDRLTYTQWIN